MQVEVNTMDEFCDELRREHNSVYRGIVRWRIDEEPQQAEAVSIEVGCHATTIINCPDSDYLLQLSKLAGVDIPQSNELNGSEQAARWEMELLATCDELDLSIRPGKYEI